MGLVRNERFLLHTTLDDGDDDGAVLAVEHGPRAHPRRHLPFRDTGGAQHRVNAYHEVRSQLDAAKGDDVVEPAAALFELAERRPDCFGDQDRELIEGFRAYLDRGG